MPLGIGQRPDLDTFGCTRWVSARPLGQTGQRSAKRRTPKRTPSGGSGGTHHLSFGKGGGYGPTRTASARWEGSARNRLPATTVFGRRTSARQQATQQRTGTVNRPTEPPPKPSGRGRGNEGCGTRPSRTRFSSTEEPEGQLAAPQARKERNCPGRLGGRDNWLSGPAGAPQPLGRGAGEPMGSTPRGCQLPAVPLGQEPGRTRCSARSSGRRADRKVEPNRGGIFGTRQGGSHPNRATWDGTFGPRTTGPPLRGRTGGPFAAIPYGSNLFLRGHPTGVSTGRNQKVTP